MKVCPTCDCVFDDDTLSFCLMDGTPLVVGETLRTVAISGEPTLARNVPVPTNTISNEPTIVQHIPAPTEVLRPMRSAEPTELIRPASKHRSRVLWVVGGLLGLVAIIVIPAMLISMMIRKGDAVRANQNRAKAAQNGKNSSKTPPVDGLDDVTPITWDTAAVTFNTEPGRSYRFKCPAGGTAGVVWGSDIYATGSSVCTAGVHAGVIGLDNGGELDVELRPGRAIYGSTERNGIKSEPLGEYPSSFVVRKPGGPIGN